MVQKKLPWMKTWGAARQQAYMPITRRRETSSSPRQWRCQLRSTMRESNTTKIRQRIMKPPCIPKLSTISRAGMWQGKWSRSLFSDRCRACIIEKWGSQTPPQAVSSSCWGTYSLNSRAQKKLALGLWSAEADMSQNSFSSVAQLMFLTAFSTLRKAIMVTSTKSTTSKPRVEKQQSWRTQQLSITLVAVRMFRLWFVLKLIYQYQYQISFFWTPPMKDYLTFHFLKTLPNQLTNKDTLPQQVTTNLTA